MLSPKTPTSERNVFTCTFQSRDLEMASFLFSVLLRAPLAEAAPQSWHALLSAAAVGAAGGCCERASLRGLMLCAESRAAPAMLRAPQRSDSTAPASRGVASEPYGTRRCESEYSHVARRVTVPVRITASAIPARLDVSSVSGWRILCTVWMRVPLMSARGQCLNHVFATFRSQHTWSASVYLKNAC